MTFLLKEVLEDASYQEVRFGPGLLIHLPQKVFLPWMGLVQQFQISWFLDENQGQK